MSKLKTRTFLKWLLIAFFVINISFELIYDISNQSIGATSVARITLLLTLIIIILYNNRYTWLFSLCIFTYGMYNVMIIDTHSSSPTVMEFTQSLTMLLDPQQIKDIPHIIVNTIPISFYFLAFLTFTTATVRKRYGFHSFRGKSQDSYLK